MKKSQSKLSTEERRLLIVSEYLSTRRSLTVPELALKLGVARNTAAEDLYCLERRGEAFPEDPNAKPVLWYATQPRNGMEMTAELAYALNCLSTVIQAHVPDAVFKDLKEPLQAANDMVKKAKARNPNDKLVRYSNVLSGIDLHKHIASGTINGDTVSVIKDAVFNDHDVAIELKDSWELLRLKSLKLSETNGTLFVRGINVDLPNDAIEFEAELITKIELREHLAWGKTPSRNRAA